MTDTPSTITHPHNTHSWHILIIHPHDTLPLTIHPHNLPLITSNNTPFNRRDTGMSTSDPYMDQMLLSSSRSYPLTHPLITHQLTTYPLITSNNTPSNRRDTGMSTSGPYMDQMLLSSSRSYPLTHPLITHQLTTYPLITSNNTPSNHRDTGMSTSGPYMDQRLLSTCSCSPGLETIRGRCVSRCALLTCPHDKTHPCDTHP